MFGNWKYKICITLAIVFNNTGMVMFINICFLENFAVLGVEIRNMTYFLDTQKKMCKQQAKHNSFYFPETNVELKKTN